jgi:hypothetical protein
MPSSGMLCRVAIVRTDVSEELSDSIIRVTRIGELGTLTVTSNRRTLRRNTILVLTRGTRRNIREDNILHSQRRENLESYIIRCRFISNCKWGFALWKYHYENTTHKYASHIHNTHHVHTITHITQNNATKNRAKKNKSAHKATRTVKDILQPMDTN